MLRISHDCSIFRNVFCYYSPGSYSNITTNSDTFHYRNIRTNINIVTNDRSFPFIRTNRYAMI